MRFLSHALICALVGTAPSLALAQDAPTAACPLRHADAEKKTDLVDATYLGLMTESISLQRASDLQLPPGTGLNVVAVAPDSPAGKAGFQAGDVLTKLDDQLLVNAAQLRVLMRLYQADAQVSVHIVRQGKPQTLKATLATRKLPPLPPGGEEPRMLLPDGGQGNFRVIPFGDHNLPPDILKQLPKEFREHFKHIRPIPPQPNDKDRILDEAEKEAEQLLDGTPDHTTRSLNFSSRIMSNDGAHTITVEQGQREHLKITDHKGNTLFDAALPKTDKAWEKVPAEVRAKAKALVERSHIQIQGDKDKQEKVDGKKPGQSF